MTSAQTPLLGKFQTDSQELPRKSSKLVAEKTREWKKLANLVQNRSIGSIVGTRPTAAPRNGRRDNVGGIMTI